MTVRILRAFIKSKSSNPDDKMIMCAILQICHPRINHIRMNIVDFKCPSVIDWLRLMRKRLHDQVLIKILHRSSHYTATAKGQPFRPIGLDCHAVGSMLSSSSKQPENLVVVATYSD